MVTESIHFKLTNDCMLLFIPVEEKLIISHKVNQDPVDVSPTPTPTPVFSHKSRLNSTIHFVKSTTSGIQFDIRHSPPKFPDSQNFSGLVGHIVRLSFLACNIWISAVVYSLILMPIFIL